METYFAALMLPVNSAKDDRLMIQIAALTITGNPRCVTVACKQFFQNTTVLSLHADTSTDMELDSGRFFEKNCTCLKVRILLGHAISPFIFLNVNLGEQWFASSSPSPESQSYADTTQLFFDSHVDSCRYVGSFSTVLLSPGR